MKVADKVVCEGCGVSYFPALAWKHAGCANAVTELASNTAASNEPLASNASASNVGFEPRSASNKQRWDREKYNEYMRAYMAKRRKENRHGDY